MLTSLLRAPDGAAPAVRKDGPRLRHLERLLTGLVPLIWLKATATDPVMNAPPNGSLPTPLAGMPDPWEMMKRGFDI